MTLHWNGPLTTTGPAIVLVFFLFFLSHRLRHNMTRRDWIIILSLLVAWVGGLMPYLFFTDHQSETYCYGGLMILSLVFSRLLWGLCTRKDGTFQGKLYAAVVVTVAILYSCGTWVKTQRVRDCGDAVTRIFTQLPGDKLRQGDWRVLLANFPGEPATKSYGTYGFKGVDTLGYGDYGRPAVESALQYAFRNSRIKLKRLAPINCDRNAPLIPACSVTGCMRMEVSQMPPALKRFLAWTRSLSNSADFE